MYQAEASSSRRFNVVWEQIWLICALLIDNMELAVDFIPESSTWGGPSPPPLPSSSLCSCEQWPVWKKEMVPFNMWARIHFPGRTNSYSVSQMAVCIWSRADAWECFLYLLSLTLRGLKGPVHSGTELDSSLTNIPTLIPPEVSLLNHSDNLIQDSCYTSSVSSPAPSTHLLFTKPLASA